MHRTHQSWLALIAVAVGVASGPALAADFTFTVPVQVTNLPPDSRQGGVSCALYTSPTISAGRDVGRSTANLPISGGAYRGEVTVAIDVRPGVDPATVTHYSCALSFYATLRDRNQQFAYWAGLDTAAPRLPVTPSAPFTPRVDGPIR